MAKHLNTKSDFQLLQKITHLQRKNTIMGNPLIGDIAPDFTCSAVGGDGNFIDNFNLHKRITNKYALLFFYPLDFTFVCPSELIALNNRMDRFRALDTEVITMSGDSHFTHNAWRNTSPESGGVGPVSFTMASDLDGTILSSYGLRAPSNKSHYETGTAMRGTFVIDQNRIVRHQSINDEPIGRNIDEFLRIVEGLQFFEENGQVCPAGWNQGDPGMVNTSSGVADYFKTHAERLLLRISR